ncbi:MAG: prepilin-type N-terminal cleavage/methylation domain-containing protein [Lentimonas sp.]|jgi:prepilin-type N-terminal cleavage/methylation domain-containing protein
MHLPDSKQFDVMSPATRRAAFSLVEVMVSMLIFTLLALALTKALLFSKMTAEDNLYEATALTVAISTIEQMKGASLNLLSNPVKSGGYEIFEMNIGGDSKHPITLAQENVLEVPIITNAQGLTSKSLKLTLTPDIQPMENSMGYWLSIKYSYDHPRTGRTRTQIVRNARSTIPSM